MAHVPHADLTPGYWYLRTDYSPGFTIVSLTPFAIGPDAGRLGVWSIDEEGNDWIEDYAHDQFIGPVPPPA